MDGSASTQEHLKNTEELKKTFANSGFKTPPGALQKSLEHLANEHENKTSELIRSQTQRNYDARRARKQSAITNALAVEQMLRQYHLSMMEMSLNVSKYVYQSAVTIHDEQIKRYNLELEKYKTELTGQAQQFQIIQLKLNDYTTRLEAVKLKRELRKDEIELHQAILNAAKLTREIYNSELDSLNIYANIENLRLQGYSTQLLAYTYGLKAKQMEFDAYRMSLQGEDEKFKLYDAQIKSYSSLLQSKQMEADIKGKKFTANSETAKIQMQNYNSKIQAYTAKLQKESNEINRLTETYKAQLSAYSNEANAIEKAFQIFMQSSQIKNQGIIEQSKQTLEKAQLELTKMDKQANLRLHATSQGAEVYKNLASSALSSINTLASINQNIEA
ncbi:hypothetical protein MCHI_003105 [Candidatus Magnetoovum chiemensis]|nr:hypothetical protein MCHI_003105 [Candidatus Magnetoovum chiemensis]